MDTQVLIVGAGPVGLTLAIDLAQRGIRCIVIERNEAASRLPKMERCNARTMEIYRRLGIAEVIRDAGYGRNRPMDVFIVLSLVEPAILHLPYPSVSELKAAAAASNDGKSPLEPYQLISQYTLEPLLKSIAEQDPNTEVLFGHELLSFDQNADAVVAQIQGTNGSLRSIRALYMVGCDGGSSTVRKRLKIALRGEAEIMRLRQALFRCDDLYDRIPIGRGRHYHIADAHATQVVVQDDCKHFSLHSIVDSDQDMPLMFRKAIGMPVDFQMLSVTSWTQHLMVADRYADRRVFLAGDAAHLVIPTGGLGMNTGIGDAIDISWKLAAVILGWGGPKLLDSYQIERRSIGLRNVNASREASAGRRRWRAAYHPDIHCSTPEGALRRAHLAKIADIEQRKSNELLGIELGYRYIDSPIICPEAGDGPDPNSFVYTPSTWPGTRLPHVWLDDGSAIHDALGKWFTLVRLDGARTSTSSLERAFHALGTPLQILEVRSQTARDIYGYDFLLLRPDLHVVWRGNALPDTPNQLAAVATGHGWISL